MIKENFKTIDKFNKPYYFLCEQIEDSDDHHLSFHIKTIIAHPKGEFYEFELEKIDDQLYGISIMHNHHDVEYMEKGITEYLIPFLMEKLNIKIVSSTHIGIPGVYRSEKANKFWEKMVEKNKAKYDNKNKRYEFIKNAE